MKIDTRQSGRSQGRRSRSVREGRPMAVPPLQPSTDDEIRRFSAAPARKQSPACGRRGGGVTTPACPWSY
jgi:hypothetical protein